MPAIAKLRKARAGHDLGIGQQRLNHRAQAGRTQYHGFFTATRMQNTLGENMPAFWVCTKLRLIHGDKGIIAINRHAFHSGQHPACALWHNALFTGNKRNLFWPFNGANPVINLPRQQAQRKADKAGTVRTKPLNSQMRFAGIGRPQYGDKLLL